MALDADDEILQDFLVEASEILELLNEQLVDLEQRPTDADLLNAVFRGFHTIKGGAGFLALDPLVSVCHRAEDVFNLLRNGEKHVTADLMDTMLQVLDVLNDQFSNLHALEDPDAADPELLRTLEQMNCPDGDEPVAETTAEPAGSAEGVTAEATSPPAAQPGSDASGDITDDEFEALLDAINGGTEQATTKPAVAAQPPSAPSGSANSDEISEDEFEKLLDELHGEGQFKTPAPSPAEPVEKSTSAQGATTSAATSGSDQITEDEFDALLDQIHGKGKFGSTDGAEPQASPPPAVAKPTPAPAPKAAKSKAPAAKKPAAKKRADGPQTETTVRVDTKRLDDIMNMVGELVLVRNRLATLAYGEVGDIDGEEMGKAVANLDVVTGDLQTSVMKTRMQPIKKVFGRFPRVVRDLARSLKKDVNLVLEGEDTDLDKNLVEALADPLVHLVRNAVDHGVEMPDERESAGKSRVGIVRLAAAQEGDHILLSIQDDGAGMDADLLRNLAVSKGVLDEEGASRLDDKDAFMLIFAPGFSTKSEISDISGRGVGMDVVKTRINQLNGSIDIDSKMGEGTLLNIKVPLTLAIMPTLMVKLAQQTFALPLVSVSEIFDLDLTESNLVDGQRVVMIRGRALPLHYLSRWLIKGEAQHKSIPDAGHVVVVNVGGQQVGFLVDKLIGQEEVVIKPLGAMLHGTKGLAGATITGDGKIALILDVPSLLKCYAHSA